MQSVDFAEKLLLEVMLTMKIETCQNCSKLDVKTCQNWESACQPLCLLSSVTASWLGWVLRRQFMCMCHNIIVLIGCWLSRPGPLLCRTHQQHIPRLRSQSKSPDQPIIVNIIATITTNVIIVTMINNILFRQFSWPPFADVHQAGWRSIHPGHCNTSHSFNNNNSIHNNKT